MGPAEGWSSAPAGLRRVRFWEKAFKDEPEFAGQQEGNFWQSKPWKQRHMEMEQMLHLVWPSLGGPKAGGTEGGGWRGLCASLGACTLRLSKGACRGCRAGSVSRPVWASCVARWAVEWGWTSALRAWPFGLGRGLDARGNERTAVFVTLSLRAQVSARHFTLRHFPLVWSLRQFCGAGFISLDREKPSSRMRGSGSWWALRSAKGFFMIIKTQILGAAKTRHNQINIKKKKKGTSTAGGCGFNSTARGQKFIK